MDEILIYTDGAYSPSRNQGGWAFVLLKDNDKLHSDYNGVINTTNNRMEIQSVIEAIKYIKSIKINKFTIFSDSMYVIGTMTKNWKRNKNNDLWDILDGLVNNLDINWVHVKGHSGDKWNNHCDLLAVAGSKLILTN